MSQQTASKFRALSNPVFICLLLAAATLAVYWPVKNYGFIDYDDPDYFTSNPHVLSGLTTSNIAWAFTTGHASNWHPLTWLSLMLDAQIFGNNAFGPHFTNLLFHAANAILLFLLLRRMTNRFWPSAVVAALFALHPLNVESVAWISERKNVLSMLFGLSTVFMYALYVEKRGVHRRESHICYALAIALFVCSLMSKQMLVTLPFVFLLLDYWPLGRWQMDKIREWRAQLPRLALEKTPFFLLSALGCLVAFIAEKKGGSVKSIELFSIGGRIENAFVSYIRYLGKIFWPENLAVFYPHLGHWPITTTLAAAIFIFFASVVIFRQAGRFPFLSVGWFWFLGTLIPVIGLVQEGTQSMADRHAYVPAIGVFIIFVWGAGVWCANWRVPRPLVIFVAAIILAACAARTRTQLGYWQNSGTLFRHALAVTENNPVACNNFGAWLVDQGQTTEAMDYFQKSLRMNPDNAGALYNLGEIQARLGNLDAAENYYRRALQIDPDYADALYNLGNTLTRLGRVDEAIANYRRALQIDPDRADVLDNLGFALAAEKQFAEAVTNFEEALKLDPDFADAHNNLATVFFLQGRFEEAAKQFYAALQLSPDDPRIAVNLGDTFVQLGNTNAAVECYKQALQLQPDNQKIRAKLQRLGIPPSN